LILKDLFDIGMSIILQLMGNLTELTVGRGKIEDATIKGRTPAEESFLSVPF